MASKYLLWFAHEHNAFRDSELKSLVSLFHVELTLKSEVSEEVSFCIVETTTPDKLIELTRRSILIRHMIKLWGHGTTDDELFASIRQSLPCVERKCFDASSTFKIRITSFGRKIAKQRHDMLMERLDFLPCEGRVDLHKPDYLFMLIEDYGTDRKNLPPLPHALYFGQWMTDGARDLIHQFCVRNRCFIGNTSMDAQLAFIMANQAKVFPGALVLDPFVGTAGVAIACAKYGAYTVGTDVNWVLLHGKGKSSRSTESGQLRGEQDNFRSAFAQYNLSAHCLDMAVADASRPAWRANLRFDAIVTDPPYGVREGSVKVSYPASDPSAAEGAALYARHQANYQLSDLLLDLLDFASIHLVEGGRLVYWLPIHEQMFSFGDIPCHPLLRVVSICKQKLSGDIARLLITMEKSQCRDGASDHNWAKSHAGFRGKYFNKTNGTATAAD